MEEIRTPKISIDFDGDSYYIRTNNIYGRPTLAVVGAKGVLLFLRHIYEDDFDTLISVSKRAARNLGPGVISELENITRKTID